MKNLIDLFCGTGGFAQGFLRSNRGFDLLYAIDSNKFAVNTASVNHQSSLVDSRDIRAVEPSEIDDQIGKSKVDVIIGGPPCQGFSSLRPNRGSIHNDDRNNLFLSFARFVDYFRPKVFVMENVVGLITHDKGKTLERIQDEFWSLDYTTDWKILNAASYGVPQKRERLIMIGCSDNADIAFPEPSHFYDGRVIGHTDKSRFLPPGHGKPPALTVIDAIGDLPELKSGQFVEEYDKGAMNAYQEARRNGASRLSLHKASNHSQKMLEVIRHSGESIACIPKHLITSGFSSCYSRLAANEPSTTITVKFQSPASSKCIHPSQDRTITPREAARLQSFDDDYFFSGPLTHVASQIGNAVPPLLGQAISNSIADMLGE
jgi:DNA (cytosine-5)-methyltransferase 1